MEFVAIKHLEAFCSMNEIENCYSGVSLMSMVNLSSIYKVNLSKPSFERKEKPRGSDMHY